MDELCKMLADKLGIVADSSMEWLQTAIPQYSKMMAISHSIYAAFAVICLAVIAFMTYRAFRNANEYDRGFVVLLGAVVGVICVFFIACFLPDAICWMVTPDAMLLNTLINRVM